MYIGIDLGTSAVKIVLVDERQDILASVEQPLAPKQPKPLWSEDDPDDWWRAVAAGLDRMSGSRSDLMQQVRAIGLSGQMHGAVLLGHDDQPIRPAILWNDGRAHAEAKRLAERGSALIDRVGVWPMPGITGPKFLWLREHEPAVLDRLRVFMLPKDYIRLKLSGERTTDVSDAAGTWLLDQEKRAWCPEALEACGVRSEWLPGLVEAYAPSGQLRPDLAVRWGMPSRVVIAGGGGDAATGGVALGAVADGDAFISLGTSAQIFVAGSRHRPASRHLIHAFCHAAPNAWYQMAAMLSGASPLATAARWVGAHDIPALVGEVEANYKGLSRLVFLPYLAGERTPHNDPYARGVLFGLDHATTRADIVQSVLEGAALMLLDGVQTFHEAGVDLRTASLIGGGSRSAFWARLIAAATGLELRLVKDADRGPAFGAARLARMSDTGERIDQVVVQPSVEAVIAPDPALHALYRVRLDLFRRLYQTLKPEFEAHATTSRPSI